MTEELLRLPVDDGVVLHGKYRAGDGPLVVLVHGLTGHMDEALHYNAARLLSAEGFAVLRFNLYGGEPGTRRLVDCTTATHARDLDAVVGRTRIPGRPTYVVGHSLGGLTALLASEPVDGLVLWEASGAADLHVRLLEQGEVVPELGVFRWRSGIDKLLNPAMVDELATIDSDALAQRVEAPVLVVGAEAEGRPELARRYAEAAGADLVLVPGSDHSFTLGETQADLFDATVRWLRRR